MPGLLRVKLAYSARCYKGIVAPGVGGTTMPNPGDPPSSSRPNESPLDRMMRFGAALFAVPKDELPKRDERPKRKPSRKKPKPA